MQISTCSFLFSLVACAGMILLSGGCEKENQAPGCRITGLESGALIAHGSQVIISVDAYDEDGEVYGVTFYVNDSSIGVSNSIPYQYTWNSLKNRPGVQTIRATAKDDDGATGSDHIMVTLTEGVPEAGFSVYQNSVCPDSAVLFFNRSINHPESWLWDFGDGKSSELPDPIHRYTHPGSYTVTLSVSNSHGRDTETKANLIMVPAPVKDYDGNVYQTVRIGEQLWMKENLKSTHYADGTALVDGTGAGDISGDYQTRYQFAYYDNENYVAVYGRLYTWAAAMNGAPGSETNPGEVQGVCPDGWHLPSDGEWQELEMYLGFTEREANETFWRGYTEGLMLRDSGAVYWNDLYRDYIAGNDVSGFMALPAGSRHYDGSFSDITKRANFWTATESLESYAWQRRLYYNHATIYRYDDYKSRAYSVRCVKDE